MKVVNLTVEIVSVHAVNILMFGVKVTTSWKGRYSKNNQKMFFLLFNLLDVKERWILVGFQ